MASSVGESGCGCSLLLRAEAGCAAFLLSSCSFPAGTELDGEMDDRAGAAAAAGAGAGAGATAAVVGAGAGAGAGATGVPACCAGTGAAAAGVAVGFTGATIFFFVDGILEGAGVGFAAAAGALDIAMAWLGKRSKRRPAQGTVEAREGEGKAGRNGIKGKQLPNEPTKWHGATGGR